MRQSHKHTNQYRLLIIYLLILISNQAIAQSQTGEPTAITTCNVATSPEKVRICIKLLRFTIQDIYVELRTLNGSDSVEIKIPASDVTCEGGNCFTELNIKFPPGETKIFIYDSNHKLISQRTRNTDPNSAFYDPSKGGN